MEVKNKIGWWQHELHIDKQKKFAEMLDVTDQQISIWKKQKQQPDLKTSYKLAQRLTDYIGQKVYIEDLFEWLP